MRTGSSRNSSNDGAALENKLVGGIQVSNSDRRLELRDAGGRNRRFLLGIVIVFLVGPVVDFRKKLGSDAPATLQGPGLGMVDGHVEGVLPAERRSRGQSVISGVGAGFAGNVDSDDGAGSRVFGVIRPSFRGGFLADIARLQWNGRVTVPVKALRTLQADADTPIGQIAKAKN